MEPLVEKCDKCDGKGEKRRELKAGDWVLDRQGYLFRVATETSPSRDGQLRWVRQNGNAVYIGGEVGTYPDEDAGNILTPYEAAALIAGLKVEDAGRIEALKGEENDGIRVWKFLLASGGSHKVYRNGLLYFWNGGRWELLTGAYGDVPYYYLELHGPEKAAFLLKHPLGVGNGK